MILKKYLKSFIQSCNFNLIGLLKLRKQQFFRNSSPSAGWEEEETMLALLIKSPLNWHIKKWNGYNVVRVIQLSRVSRTFAALQILFFIFLLKWGIKWTRFWNSSWNIEFSIFNFKCFLFEAQKYFVALKSSFIFQICTSGHIDSVISTLVNIVKLDIENDNVVWRLSNVVNTNI